MNVKVLTWQLTTIQLLPQEYSLKLDTSNIKKVVEEITYLEFVRFISMGMTFSKLSKHGRKLDLFARSVNVTQLSVFVMSVPSKLKRT